jgi:DHA2 family multidrug resistance protein-like MFS transporter
MLLITQYLQLVALQSPLRAGLWMLPSAGAATASFLGATLLVRRFRPAYLIGAGLAAAVLGLLLITQVRTSSSLGVLTTGFVFINLGSGPLLTLGTDLIVGSVPPAKAGSAAAMNETSGEFGFALGIAVLGSIATAAYRHELRGTLPAGIPQQAAQDARDSLANASTVAGTLPGRLQPELLSAAQHAFVDGMRIVAGVSALVLAGVAVLTVRLLRHVPSSAAAADRPEPSTAAPAG